MPISYETNDKTRLFQIPKIIDGAVTLTAGDRERDTTIENSGILIAPEIIAPRPTRAVLRAFGRNWNFAGRSAEICKLIGGL